MGLFVLVFFFFSFQWKISGIFQQALMSTTIMASASGSGQYEVKGDFVLVIAKEDELRA